MQGNELRSIKKWLGLITFPASINVEHTTCWPIPKKYRYDTWEDKSGIEYNRKAMYYNDVIMGAVASQITSVSIVCSTVDPGADQRKHQSSASLAFVQGMTIPLDCFTSHVGEHRTVRGLCKFREFPEFLKYPQCSSPRKRKRLLFTSRWRRSSRWRRQGIPRVYLDTSQLDWRVIIGRTSANQSVF